jgi:hypothetical protein
MFKNLRWVLFSTLLMAFASFPAAVLARDSAHFKIDQSLILEGKKIQSGVYDVQFVPKDQKATVTFKLHRQVAAVVQGKIVEANKPYEYNAAVLAKDSSGHEILKGLQFAGEKTEIIFE